MRAAIATDGGFVSAHFGRCPEFTLVDLENGEIVKKETVSNPGHQPGFIPKFLAEKGVHCIIAGGMGNNAQALFGGFGIKVIVGVSGKIDDVLEDLKSNALVSGNSLCQPGSGKGYGLDKNQCSHPHGRQHRH